MKKIVILTLALIGYSTLCFSQDKKVEGIFAEFNTTKGKIVVQLTYQKTPITVANFVTLAEGENAMVTETLKGKPYYDGLVFHRVISDFMIQGGCPKGDGTGDPGYKFVDEITELAHDKPGILSMANAGVGTNGSQFFITHKATPWLDGNHTVFGHVILGQDIVNAIAKNDVIQSIKIIRNGKEAKKFNAKKVINDYFANKENNDKIQNEKNAIIKKQLAEIAAEKQRKLAEIAAEQQKVAREKALKEFANATTTASGLKYIVLQQGSGAKPLATSNVKVHYTGMFLDGKVFDSSVQRGETIDFGLNQVIKGWTEGVQLMPEGSKYKFYIPSQLAYGERGAGGGVIPPNADLIFEIELIKINK
jgi:FKBP-type peptidyl-prolyl cis-trans isomerase